MNSGENNSRSCKGVRLVDRAQSEQRDFSPDNEQENKAEAFTRRRSVHFVAVPATVVVVPGSEEKEYRCGAVEGLEVRAKEVYPSGFGTGVPQVDEEEEDNDSDEEENKRLQLAREIARRQSELATHITLQSRKQKSSRLRSPPLVRGSQEQEESVEREDQPEMNSVISRLEDVFQRLENAILVFSDIFTAQAPVPNQLSDYDTTIEEKLQNFLSLSKKIGDEVLTQSSLVADAFDAHKNFITLALTTRKPEDSELKKLLEPLSNKISEIQTHRETLRQSKYFNHLSAVSESISALGWISVAPAPAPYVRSMRESAEFYTNRVLKEWKEHGPEHTEWSKAWLQVLEQLQVYVKDHHTTGITWNTNTGVVPPPPPPPPQAMGTPVNYLSGMSAVLAEINKGVEITKGLRKVSAELQTHKNSSQQLKLPKVSSSQNAPNQAAKFELHGKKWLIENHRNNGNLLVSETSPSHSVYICQCENCSIKVEGKVNNIVLDSCRKTSVVFDDVISSCQFINCQSVQMQVIGKLPTIQVEKTDGCQMFLSNDSLEVEIVSAKSSEMNVLIPGPNGDFVEHPIPEQFKTVIKNSKLNTSISELS